MNADRRWYVSFREKAAYLGSTEEPVRPLLFLLNAVSAGAWTLSSCGGHREVTMKWAERNRYARVPDGGWRARFMFDADHRDAGLLRSLVRLGAWKRWWIVKRHHLPRRHRRLAFSESFCLLGGATFGCLRVGEAVKQLRRLLSLMRSETMCRLSRLQDRSQKIEQAWQARLAAKGAGR